MGIISRRRSPQRNLRIQLPFFLVLTSQSEIPEGRSLSVTFALKIFSSISIQLRIGLMCLFSLMFPLVSFTILECVLCGSHFIGLYKRKIRFVKESISFNFKSTLFFTFLKQSTLDLLAHEYTKSYYNHFFYQISFFVNIAFSLLVSMLEFFKLIEFSLIN